MGHSAPLFLQHHLSIEKMEEDTTMGGGPNTPLWKLYDNPFFNPHPTPFEDQPRYTMESKLKAELDLERRLRRKAESVNKALLRDLWEERQKKEAAVESLTAEMEKLRSEVAEERKMMRVAEVLREERVHMKLSEARLAMEEKIHRFSTNQNDKDKNKDKDKRQPRKEVENPHIRRGIVGYVEFPTKLVRTRVADSFLDVGPKLECQKAQLRVLLKHNNRVSPATDNFVM